MSRGGTGEGAPPGSSAGCRASQRVLRVRCPCRPTHLNGRKRKCRCNDSTSKTATVMSRRRVLDEPRSSPGRVPRGFPSGFCLQRHCGSGLCYVRTFCRGLCCDMLRTYATTALDVPIFPGRIPAAPSHRRRTGTNGGFSKRPVVRTPFPYDA